MALDTGSTKAKEAAKAIADAAAEATEPESVDEKELGKTQDGGLMISAEMAGLAKKLPEKDNVQKATKAAMLAKTPQAEVKEKVKVVKASPDSEETPSGAALAAVEGISDDEERRKAYRAVKMAMRSGVLEA